jgi:hypothetical protein
LSRQPEAAILASRVKRAHLLETGEESLLSSIWKPPANFNRFLPTCPLRCPLPLTPWYVWHWPRKNRSLTPEHDLNARMDVKRSYKKSVPKHKNSFYHTSSGASGRKRRCFDLSSNFLRPKGAPGWRKKRCDSYLYLKQPCRA